MADKQKNLETLKHEKVDLEQTLEKEQEALVNRLWKKMDKLEKEKRYLQNQLGQPISLPPSPIPDQYGRCLPNTMGMPPLGSSTGGFYPNNNSRNLSYTAGSDSDRSLTNYNNQMHHSISGSQTPSSHLQGGQNKNNLVLGSTPIQNTNLNQVNSCSNQLSTQNLSTASMGSNTSIHSLNNQQKTENVNKQQQHQEDPTEHMSAHIRQLRRECELLKRQLHKNQVDYKMHYDKISMDEKYLRDENRKLHEKLKMEKERSDRLCRALSESESSLDSSWLEWDALSASGMEYLKDLRHPKPRTVSSPQTHLQGPSGQNQVGGNVTRGQNQQSGSGQNLNNNNNNITAMRYEPKYNHDIMMNYPNNHMNYPYNPPNYIPDHSRSVAEAFAPTSHFSHQNTQNNMLNPHHPYTSMSTGPNNNYYSKFDNNNTSGKLSTQYPLNFPSGGHGGSQQNLTPISTSGIAVSYSGTNPSNNPSLRGDRDHPRLNDVDCHSLVSESGSELEKIMASSGISENDQHHFMTGASANNYMNEQMAGRYYHNRSATHQNPNSNNNVVYKRDHSTHSHRSMPNNDGQGLNANNDQSDQNSQDEHLLVSSIKENQNKPESHKKNSSLGSIYKNCVNGAKSMFNQASGDHSNISLVTNKNTISNKILDTSRNSSTSSSKIGHNNVLVTSESNLNVGNQNSNENSREISIHSSKEIDSELDFNENNEADDENDVEETEAQRTTPTN